MHDEPLPTKAKETMQPTTARCPQCGAVVVRSPEMPSVGVCTGPERHAVIRGQG